MWKSSPLHRRFVPVRQGSGNCRRAPSELTQEKIHEIYQSNAQDLMLDMQGEAV